MRLLRFLLLALICVSTVMRTEAKDKRSVLEIDNQTLYDKLKGGWAGQTIGVCYGGPTEFRYQGRMIADSIAIPWDGNGYIKSWMERFPGLFDDIYMDLTFVETFNRIGLDAPVDSLAMAFANAEYNLWEANQTARYNILSGIMPPASGHWKNNPHADDIDFQIESDFAGLMNPGMPNSATEVCDRVGHIMNYGDGWYGGVYVAAMYSLAYVCDDIECVVTQAMRCLPEKSRYRRCIEDVVAEYRKNPTDWKKAWQMCAEKWDLNLPCPTGAFVPYNIDAVLNGAYVTIGLLYGNGDFEKTMDIATRCGQDSDCNPSSAAGVLGTMLGYSKIPEKWIASLREAEDIVFAYTSSSMNDVYLMSYSHALEMVLRNGGNIDGEKIAIVSQEPKPVAFEASFDGLKPVSKDLVGVLLGEGPVERSVECDGFVLTGGVTGDKDTGYVAEVEVTIDNDVVDVVKMPVDFATRRYDVYWNYDMDGQSHNIGLRLLNPSSKNDVKVNYLMQLRR